MKLSSVQFKGFLLRTLNTELKVSPPLKSESLFLSYVN